MKKFDFEIISRSIHAWLQSVNEYKPKFYPNTIADIEVAEDTPVGTVIAQITIIDEDKSAGHEIDVSTIALANSKANISTSFFSRRFSKKNADYSSDFFFKTNELTDFIKSYK